jgi:hypothetical protein
VKRLVAILFSLLLILEQTLAVAVPVSSKSCAPKAGSSCCGSDCQCHVDQGGGSPVSPVESAAPTRAAFPSILLPAECVIFETAPAGNSSSVPSTDSLMSVARQPLFRLNCALLI